MDQILVRNVVAPQSDKESKYKLNFNVTFANGVTIKDATVAIDADTYGTTPPNEQPALIASILAQTFADYGKAPNETETN